MLRTSLLKEMSHQNVFEHVARNGIDVVHFAQVIEVPERASNVAFHARGLPARYKSALQNVR